MTHQEKIDQIKEAINLIEQAQEIVKDAIQDTTSQPHFDAYGEYGFMQLMGNGNPYDSSLYSLIEKFEEEIDEDDDDNMTYDQFQAETHGY